MKTQLYLTLLFASLLIVNCGSKENTVTDSSPVINVKTQPVSQNSNTPFLSVSGKIQAVNSADLSTRLMGYVNKVHVAVGDDVKQGQLLVSINNADLQAKQAQVNASITEANAAFINAEKDYSRFKNLFSQKSASKKELDDVTAQFEMAKARLEAAKQMKNEINAQFSYSNITAPFSGIITAKNIKTGDMAHPGTPLLSLEKPGDFEVIAMVPETEIAAIKNGTTTNITIESIHSKLKGIVSEVSSSARHTGGQYLVKIHLVNVPKNLLSGMFATVQFPVIRQNKSDIVLIPTEALINNIELSGVYTVSQSNTAILRWLRLGRIYGDQVEVLSGLNADESFIISADGKLYNGAKISIN